MLSPFTPAGLPLITVTGGNAVGNTKTATINGGIGAIQWSHYNATTGVYIGDISSATAATYTIVAADVGFFVGPRVTSYSPYSLGSSFVPAQYTQFRAAMAAVLAGTGYAKIALVGDSTTTGYLSGGTSSPLTNGRVISPTVLLKNTLAGAQTRPVIANSWVGDQNVTANSSTLYAYDPRITAPDGVGWSSSGSGLTSAGARLQQNTADTKRLSFLPTDGAVDTFEVTYPTNTTLGAIQLARVGMTNTAVSEVAAAGIAKTVVTSALSSANTLDITRTSGSAYVIATDAWNSAVKSVRLLGVGWNGGKSSDLVDTTFAYSALPGVKALACDLYVVRLGVNDWFNSIPVATFKTNFATLIDALLTVGNVLVCMPYPTQATVVPLATQQLYVNAMQDVANTRGLAVDNTFAAFGSWEAANALGYMADGLHPNQSGYQAAANTCSSAILNLLN